MKSNKQKTIALIGGFGFIGSYIVADLLKTKTFQNIYVLGRSSYRVYSLQENIYVRDDYRMVCPEKELRRVSYVIYLACNSTPFSSVNSKFRLDDVTILRNYIDILNMDFLSQFIYLSTAGALYKSEKIKYFDESTSFVPTTPYAEQKIQEEALIESIIEHIDSQIILRPTNIYGPGQNLKLGMGIIPKLFSCSSHKESIEFYESLDSERDYLFVQDFSDLILRLIDLPMLTGTFNVSSSNNLSIRDLLININLLTGTTIDYSVVNSKPINLSRVSSKKIQVVTGWHPSTSIQEGLSKAWYCYNEE